MNEFDILNQQIENRTDINISYQNIKITDKISIYEQERKYFLQSNKIKYILKSEYLEILELCQSDEFGNKSIIFNGSYDEFWNKYYNFRDNEKLEKVGKALFGKSWKNSLAQELNVDPRRIDQWLRCESRIPAGIFNDIKGLIILKQKALNELKVEFDISALDYIELNKDELNRLANKSVFK